MRFHITAKHAALGTVEFVLEAADRKQAFANFKSIVYSYRQWSISSNEQVGKIAAKEETQGESQ